MKTKIFTTLLAILTIVTVNVTISNTNADVIQIGTNIGAWGTVFSDVEREAYYYKAYGEGELSNDGRNVRTRWINGKDKDTVDTWDYRLALMKDYLADTLANNKMSTRSDKLGVLHSGSNSLVAHNSGDDYGDSKNLFGNIYGQAAETLKGQVDTSGVQAMLLQGRSQSTNIITSSAAANNESTDHNWFYNAATDTFTSDGLTTKTGIGDHNTGIYAFVTDFNYDPATTYQYLNGWFSELGTLLGIYINGIELSDTYLQLSANMLNSQLFGQYNMEIDLAALFSAGILSNGNNNIAFLIDSILPEYNGGTVYDGNDGLIAFASNINLNTDSIFGNPGPEPTTPEPATMLIIGIGLAGLGLRRRFSK
ncbi:MAG: PEP-CTERM sorting domain-containing protein [Planctomycetaceae bacterium]|nr:PEP-CTERM sorting domain-containing protein [Planctomycetaceae bacterium]